MIHEVANDQIFQNLLLHLVLFNNVLLLVSLTNRKLPLLLYFVEMVNIKDRPLENHGEFIAISRKFSIDCGNDITQEESNHLRYPGVLETLR